MPTNALHSLERLTSEQVSRSEEAELEGGLFLIYYARILFDAEDRGRAIAAPAPLVAYMRQFNARVRQAGGCTNAYGRRRSLDAEAANFRERKGWRSAFPELADQCAHALESLSTSLRRPVGNPRRLRGETQILERRHVATVFEGVEAKFLSQGQLAAAQSLYASDDENGLVRVRRKKMAVTAAKQATAYGHEPDEHKLRNEIRAHIRTAQLPTPNALAAWFSPKKLKYRPLGKATRPIKS